MSDKVKAEKPQEQTTQTKPKAKKKQPPKKQQQDTRQFYTSQGGGGNPDPVDGSSNANTAHKDVPIKTNQGYVKAKQRPIPTKHLSIPSKQTPIPAKQQRLSNIQEPKDAQNSTSELDSVGFQSIPGFFWTDLYNKGTELIASKAQGKPFKVGVNLFGQELIAGTNQQVSIGKKGDFIYQNNEGIDIAANVQYENQFKIGKVQITNIQATNLGLQRLGLSLTQIKLAGGVINVERMEGEWDQKGGFSFDGAGIAMLGTRVIHGNVTLGLSNDGSFTGGSFYVESEGSDPITIIPNVLGLTTNDFSLNIGENKQLSGEIKGNIHIISDHIHFDTGEVVIKYENDWHIKAPAITGKVLLPGINNYNEGLEVKGGFSYENGQFTGSLQVGAAGSVDIIPGVMALEDPSFEGALTNQGWQITLAGNVGLVTEYLEAETGQIEVSYGSEGWALKTTEQIKTQVKLPEFPAGKKVTADIQLRYEGGEIEGAIDGIYTDTIEIIPGISIHNLAIKGSFEQGVLVAEAIGEPLSTLEGMKTEGKLGFRYTPAGWELITENLVGGITKEVVLPDKAKTKVIVKAALAVDNGKYKGQLKAEIPDTLVIASNVLSINNLVFDGVVEQGQWQMSLTGDFQFLANDKGVSGHVVMTYGPNDHWTLDTTLQSSEISTEVVQFEKGEVKVKYDGIQWFIKSHKIAGKVMLPGQQNIEEGLAVSVNFSYENDQFTGGFNADYKTHTIDIIPEVLSMNGVSLEGKLGASDWDITVNGQVLLASNYLTLDASAISFIYGSSGWSLTAGQITGMVHLPGENSLEVSLNDLSINHQQLEGNLIGVMDKPLEILPETLSAHHLIVEGGLKNNQWVLAIWGEAFLDTEYLRLENGKINFAFDQSTNSWGFEATGLTGSVHLPDGKIVSFTATTKLTNEGEYQGAVEAQMPDQIEAIPGILSITNPTLKGSLKDKNWVLGLAGTFDLTHKFFEVNADQVYFEYSKKEGWTLDTTIGLSIRNMPMLEFETEDVAIKYNQKDGWDIQAPEIKGSLDLPGKDTTVDVIAVVSYVNGKLSAALKATAQQKMVVVPEVLAMEGVTLEGKLDQAKGDWGLKLGGNVKLNTHHVILKNGYVSFGYENGQWNFNAENIKAQVKLPGNKKLDVNAHFGLENGKITGGIETQSSKTFTLLKDTLKLRNFKVKGTIDQSTNRWSLGVQAETFLQTKLIQINQGFFDFTYDKTNGWLLDAKNIAGTVKLPNGKVVNLEADIWLKKGKSYGGKLKTILPNKIEVIPNKLELNNLEFEGSLQDKQWAMGLGGSFAFVSNYKMFQLKAKQVKFNYAQEQDWRLIAKDIGLSMAIADHKFDGQISFAYQQGKINGDMSIANTKTYEVIPGVLNLNSGTFKGGIDQAGNVNLGLEASLSTPPEGKKHLTIYDSSVFLEYDQAKGTGWNAWTVGIKSLNGAIFDESVTIGFNEVSFAFGDKQLNIDKVTIGYEYIQQQGKGKKAPDKKVAGNIQKIMNLVEDFQVEASLKDIVIDANGVHLGNQQPAWSLREFTMQYQGFIFGVVINDTEVSAEVKGTYSKNFELFDFRVRYPIPVVPGLFATGGISAGADVHLLAQARASYNRERSNPGEAFMDVSGGVAISGGVHLEVALGASAGAGQFASIGGELFGRVRLGLSTQADVGATLVYDRASNKIRQGPEPNDKFNVRVDTELAPTLVVGGRLFAETLFGDYDLADVEFGSWKLGNGRLVFDLAPDAAGSYQVSPDKELSHFNGTRFWQDGDLKSALNDPNARKR